MQDALWAGRLSAATAAPIIALLDRVRLKITPEHLDAAEQLLAEKAVGLSLDEVRRLITHAEAWLDPDGVEPWEEEAHERRHLAMFERNGDLHFHGSVPISEGAALRTAINGSVTAAFAARKDAVDPDAPDADHRTLPQLQADGLIALCRHALGCDNDAPALAGATVIVRVDLAARSASRWQSATADA